VTKFETIITILSLLAGMLATLIATVWRARGWIDRLNATDRELSKAIRALTTSQEQMHRANQERFGRIETRLDSLTGGPGGRARGRAI